MLQLLAIDDSRFNDAARIETRVATVTVPDRGALRTVLRYLYLDDGPVNLPAKRLRSAKAHLEAAELLVIRWLFTRTNGSLRSSYGAPSLQAARRARYRCQECGFPDVRVLNLDHVDGRVAGTPFTCLCANCHTIKSRAKDWTGTKRASAAHPAEEAEV